LGVRKIQKAGDVDAEWSGEVVTFPHGSYLSMEEKKLNVPGTVLFGGLAVGAMYVLHSAFNEGSTLNTPPSVVGSPTQEADSAISETAPEARERHGCRLLEMKVSRPRPSSVPGCFPAATR